MSDYLIQDIPPEIKTGFKTACAYFNQTMRGALIDFMRVRIDHHRADTGQALAEYDRAKKKEGKKWIKYKRG